MVAFVDSNVVIYASGAESPQREPCREILSTASRATGSLMASTEILQELLHVYLRRREGIARSRDAIRYLQGVLQDNFATVTVADLVAAAEGEFPPRLQARDRIHLAVMQRLGITGIISADRAFDFAPGIRRLDPLRFAEWRGEVFGR